MEKKVHAHPGIKERRELVTSHQFLQRHLPHVDQSPGLHWRESSLDQQGAVFRLILLVCTVFFGITSECPNVNSLWDSFRSQIPFLTIFDPSSVTRMVRS